MCHTNRNELTTFDKLSKLFNEIFILSIVWVILRFFLKLYQVFRNCKKRISCKMQRFEALNCENVNASIVSSTTEKIVEVNYYRHFSRIANIRRKKNNNISLRLISIGIEWIIFAGTASKTWWAIQLGNRIVSTRSG